MNCSWDDETNIAPTRTNTTDANKGLQWKNMKSFAISQTTKPCVIHEEWFYQACSIFKEISPTSSSSPKKHIDSQSPLKVAKVRKSPKHWRCEFQRSRLTLEDLHSMEQTWYTIIQHIPPVDVRQNTLSNILEGNCDGHREICWGKVWCRCHREWDLFMLPFSCLAHDPR